MPSKKNNLKNSEEKVQTAAMRHPALYALSIIVLVVIIAAFIIGPILGQGAANPNSTVFGVFRGEKIEFAQGSYFVRAYQGQLDQLQQQAEENGSTVGLQQVYTAARNAYDSTVFRLALIDEARRAGMVVSTREVIETLANAPGFRDENGDFSSELLQSALANNPNLRETVREDIIFDKAQQDMLSRANLSDAEVEFIASMGDPRRIFDVVSFDFTDFPDDQLQAYLENNGELFRNVEISSITLDSLEEAEELLARLETGEESFEDLAATLSTDFFSAEGGSRGTVWFYDIQRDFEDESAAQLLFSQPVGEAGEIFAVRGEKFAVFRLDSEVRQPDPENRDVLEQVKGYVLSLERGLVSDYFREEAEELSRRIQEIGWASALVESGLEAATTSAVGMNYGDLPLFPNYESVSAGVLSGVSSRETLIADLFSLDLGQVSEPVQLRDRVVLVRYAEEGEQTTGQNDFLRLYIPFLAQEYLTAEMQRSYSSPENLRDNFDDTFTTLFMGSN